MGLLSRARNEYVSVRVRTHELRSKNRRRKTRGCRDWDVKKNEERNIFRLFYHNYSF